MSLNSFPELKLKGRLGDVLLATTGGIGSNTDGELNLTNLDISQYGGTVKLVKAYITAGEDYTAPAASADSLKGIIKSIDSSGSQVIGTFLISAASADTAIQSVGDMAKGRSLEISMTDATKFPNLEISSDSDVLCVWDHPDADVAGPVALDLHLEFEPVPNAA